MDSGLESPLRNGKTDRTEIDMKLGDLMVEAKRTETDFQTAPLKMIERYRDLGDVTLCLSKRKLETEN